MFDESEERLNRYYKNNEFSKKINKLTEYYKFHNEVPRMFQK